MILIAYIKQIHCLSRVLPRYKFTLKAPITTAADSDFCNIFPNFRKKYGTIFHENRLPAEDSLEISCLICYFVKSGKI